MLEKIKTVLVDAIGVEADDVVPEASLSEDLQIDSLAAVELALELESEFDITIEDEELAGLKTVQDIMDLLAEKMN
ncbi:MAG: acyl carrier protein [Ileibacterium sp.]|nr:acyl carrier protein [Ileibacterium sp.]